MNIALLALVSIASTSVALFVMKRLARVWNLERRNFRGDTIPAGFGFLLVLSALPVYLVVLLSNGLPEQILMLFIAVVGFGIIGLLDDIFGNRDAGGFHGHLGLLRRGKVSTGLLKAVLGGLLALVLGFVAADHRLLPGLLNGLVISLSANLLNLLDLRPGRAVSCFWVGVLLLWVTGLTKLATWEWLLPLIVPAALLTYLDRSAKIMLGDAGSNVLGAIFGLMLIFEAGSFTKLVVLAALVGVHIYAEKYSISKTIERNRILRRVDRLLGVR